MLDIFSHHWRPAIWSVDGSDDPRREIEGPMANKLRRLPVTIESSLASFNYRRRVGHLAHPDLGSNFGLFLGGLATSTALSLLVPPTSWCRVAVRRASRARIGPQPAKSA